uniref:Hsp70-interacting protein N-terminal domain-containing protein n=1 Tax=Setaria digitata TaxID=48799 RepID=A0A915PH74_9BILA
MQFTDPESGWLSVIETASGAGSVEGLVIKGIRKNQELGRIVSIFRRKEEKRRPEVINSLQDGFVLLSPPNTFAVFTFFGVIAVKESVGAVWFDDMQGQTVSCFTSLSIWDNGPSFILVPRGLSPDGAERVIIPAVISGPQPPFPCLVAGMGTYEHGQTFTKEHFHYKCNNGTAEVIACVADDKSVIHIGRMFIRAGVRHKCDIKGDTVTYEQGDYSKFKLILLPPPVQRQPISTQNPINKEGSEKNSLGNKASRESAFLGFPYFLDASESTCYDNGIHYDVGEHFRNGSFVLVCQKDGITIEGCYARNTDITIPVGTERILDHYLHKCELLDQGRVRYTANQLAVVGCKKDNEFFNEGQIWTSEHIRYQCTSYGIVRVLGCVDDNGLFIELGRDILMRGVVHRCYRVDKTTVYHRYACVGQTLAQCILTPQLKCNYLEGMKRSSLRSIIRVAIGYRLEMILPDGYMTSNSFPIGHVDYRKQCSCTKGTMEPFRSNYFTVGRCLLVGTCVSRETCVASLGYVGSFYCPGREEYCEIEEGVMDTQVELLRQFVNICKCNPAVLHEPRFGFYKDYLESLGAKIPLLPTKPTETKSSKPTEYGEEPTMDEEKEEPEEELELDMSGVIKGEEDEPLPMGDSSKETTEEDVEKAAEQRALAVNAFNEGNFEKAVEHFTNAIELNPGLAILHAKRANALLKLNKPNGAIRDCNKAISLNADSAQGYKFRGRAHRLLGNFVEAHRDLAMACKLDYDDDANIWLKEVEANVNSL